VALLGFADEDGRFGTNAKCRRCNVDRLWAAWQTKNPNAPYLPRKNAPAALKFHRLGDSLFSVFPNPPKVSDMLDVVDVYTYDTLADVV
jgi:hypothetical protein